MHRRITGNTVSRILFPVVLATVILAIMIDPAACNANDSFGPGISHFIGRLKSELRDVEIAHVLALAFLVPFIRSNAFRRPVRFDSLAAGLLFSFAYVAGESMKAFNDLRFITLNTVQFFIALITLSGVTVLFYCMTECLFEKLDTVMPEAGRKAVRHFRLFAFAFILVFWIILGLAYFPGSVPHDGRYALNMYYSRWFNDNHPFFSSMIIGMIYDAASSFFGNNAGTAFVVLLQAVISALVFAGVCDLFRSKLSGRSGVLCMVYYALAPMWWTYAQTVAKDTMYYVAFTWLVLELMRVILKDRDKWSPVRIILSGLMLTTFRHEGVYVAVLVFAVFFILTDRKKQMALLAACVILTGYGVNVFFVRYILHMEPKVQESYSIPFQQVARYITLHEEELTEDDKATINQVLIYERIKERYDPERSDNVKSEYNSPNNDEWNAFWKLYWRMMKKHPATFLSATLNNMYGYVDPFYFYKGMNRYQLYNKGSISQIDTDVEYSVYVFSSNSRYAASTLADIWEKIPGLSFIVNPAAYFWLSVLLFVRFLRKKNNIGLISIIPLIYLIGVFGSPVNGLLRYVLPVMSAAPLFILTAILPGSSAEKAEVRSIPVQQAS